MSKSLGVPKDFDLCLCLKLVKEPVSWDFWDKVGSDESPSYFEPKEVLSTLQALHQALWENDPHLPRYYSLREKDAGSYWRPRRPLVIQGVRYHLESGWGGCFALGENGDVIDLRQIGQIEGWDPEKERPVILVVEEESFAERLDGGHLKEMMRVCRTALHHGWWVETYGG